jgi:hypothetical protein
MKYVYLIWDEIHGLQCVYASKEKATEKIDNIAHNLYNIPEDEEPEYDSASDYGYEGAAWWQRVEVE